MLDPDDGDVRAPRALDELGHAADDGVAIVGSRHDPHLHVDDEQRGVGTVGQGGHFASSQLGPEPTSTASGGSMS